jgi:hypothetical protein
MLSYRLIKANSSRESGGEQISRLRGFWRSRLREIAIVPYLTDLAALMFGAALVAAAFPVVVISEAWISRSLSDDASQSAGLAPAMAALREASLMPRFPLI